MSCPEGSIAEAPVRPLERDVAAGSEAGRATVWGSGRCRWLSLMSLDVGQRRGHVPIVRHADTEHEGRSVSDTGRSARRRAVEYDGRSGAV